LALAECFVKAEDSAEALRVRKTIVRGSTAWSAMPKIRRLNLPHGGISDRIDA
jgi:hypothetical protein